MYNENYYRGVYKDYDFHNPPEKLLFYRSIIEKLAPKKENIKILDLGCAFGNFLASLNPKWMRFGIDVSNFAINKAKKRYRDVQFRNGDLTIIPFEEVFDIIVAFDTLEHIVDCDSLVLSLRKKLQSKGKLIFVVPVYDGPLGSIVKLLDKDPTHVHKKSRYYWLDWIEKSFEVMEWFGVVRYLLPWNYYFHMPTTIFRKFAPAIIVICCKEE
jgi:SAM-dependent methyltransferase